MKINVKWNEQLSWRSLYRIPVLFFLVGTVVLGVIATNALIYQNSCRESRRIANQTFSHKHYTVAHERLDLESAVYQVKQAHYDKLDSVIDLAVKYVNGIRANERWEGYSEQKKIESIFILIDVAIREHQIRTVDNEEMLSRGFEQNGLDCDTLSSIYLAVGQVLNLPIVWVKMPGHVIPRWHEPASSEYLNFEATGGSLESDEHYLEWFGITEDDIREFALSDFDPLTMNGMYWALILTSDDPNMKEIGFIERCYKIGALFVLGFF